MSRMFLTATLIVLLNVLVGCNAPNSGRGQLVPEEVSTPVELEAEVKPITPAEIDIIEQVAINRKAYRQGLDMLIDHYTQTGNNMKLQWAKKESNSLDTIPKYNYIIEASLASANMKAGVEIPEANDLYYDALDTEKQAGKFIVIKNDNLLRVALGKYNQLIRKYPSSDKIGDAAYRAAGILDYFKDYTIALLYYKRTYQWDPNTEHPAKYKAAYILDRHLRRRAEALDLYMQAVAGENLPENYREFAEMRISQLTKADKSVE